MNRPPRDFDLSTSPINGKRYVPPKARDQQEAARRQNNPPGELILEQQRNGLRIGRMTLNALSDRTAQDFALPILGVSALNSVYYTFAESERNLDDSVRRRRLKYPVMKNWQDRDHMLEGLKVSFAQGEKLAARLVDPYGTESGAYKRSERDFSTCVGNAALLGAAMYGLGEDPIAGTELRAQRQAREHGLRLDESRDIWAERLGSIPTLAQMADADSDVSVWWRRNAPEQAYTAYCTAQMDSLVGY